MVAPTAGLRSPLKTVRRYNDGTGGDATCLGELEWLAPLVCQANTGQT